MKFNILTIFPEYFDGALNTSLISKAREKGLLSFEIIDIRPFSKDRHRKVDDTPYGGGPGMVMSAQPIFDTVKSVKEKGDTYVILTSPAGGTFEQQKARELVEKGDLTIICGRYEGVDARVADMVCDELISIGNYITFGGDVAALVIVEAVSRLIPGVVGKTVSVIDESFSRPQRVEYPQYTRPYNFMGQKVPDVLLSGNHKLIEQWRIKKSEEITKLWRKDRE